MIDHQTPNSDGELDYQSEINCLGSSSYVQINQQQQQQQSIYEMHSISSQLAGDHLDGDDCEGDKESSSHRVEPNRTYL